MPHTDSLPHAFPGRLEQALGDPFDAASPASFQRAVELDEREEFPEEFIALLRAVGVHRYLIPRALGGALQSFEESLAALRLIARRDLTAAIAFGQTFLGSIPVWLAGSEAQRQSLAASIGDGELGCLALTEEAHGGDLMASEFRAAADGGGYLLSGRKWLINNGTRGGFATVFAATSEQPSFAGFTLFLLDKRNPAVAQSLVPVPRVRTLGIRGADISGLACRNLPVPGSAVVGEAGRGYEITLKTLQVSRTMCAALSLGAADTALRAALDFALERRIFGDTVAGIPAARDLLTGAYADLLVCDCVALAAARGLDRAVMRMPVWSSVAKYFVPATVEELIRDAGVVLGARHYLREAHYAGIFQKAMRDNLVVGLFDGSTAVNLHIVSGQLGALAAGWKRVAESPDTGAAARLGELFRSDAAAAGREFPRDAEMTFTNDGRDEIVEGLAAALQSRLPGTVAILARRLAAQLDGIDRALEELREAGDRRVNSGRRFALARRYCQITAGAACLQTWLHHRGSGNSFAASPAWLEVALQRLLARMDPGMPEPAEDAKSEVFQRMTAQLRQNELFSLFPFALAGARG